MWSALAFLCTFSAYFFYCRNIWLSTTRPTVSTWISWGIVDIALLATMVNAAFEHWPAFHSEKVSYAIAAYTFGTMAVLAVSAIKNAGWGDWGTKDNFAVGCVLLAVMAWFFTGNADWAVALTLFACTVGSAPMLMNLWRNPRAEAFLPWICVALGTLCDLADVATTGEWTIQRAASPLVFLVLQTFFLSFMARRFFRRAAHI